MAENKVTLIITADGSAYIQGVKAAGKATDEFASKTGDALGGLKANWLAYSAAVYAAYRSVKAAWDTAEMAAKFEEQKTALSGLASQYGVSADNMVESIQRAANGIISKTEAISVANKGMIMGLNPDQLVKFAEGAERFSDALGTNVTEAFGALTQAAAAGNERLLRQIGVIVDFDAAYKKFAITHNRHMDSLGEEEKQNIRVMETQARMAAAIGRMGDSGDSSADKMDRARAAMSDFTLAVGQVVLPVIGELAAALTAVIQGWQWWLSLLNQPPAKTGMEAVEAYREQLVGLRAELKELKETSISSWDVVNRVRYADKESRVADLEIRIMEVEQAMGRAADDAFHSLTMALKRTPVAVKANIELDKSLTQQIEQLTDQYNKLVMSAERYYSLREKGLVDKGADKGIAHRAIEAEKTLAAAQAHEQYRTSLLSAQVAIEKIGASKERLIELQMIEFGAVNKLATEKEKEALRQALEAAQRKQNEEDTRQRIAELQIATRKLGATKEELLAIQVAEFQLTGKTREEVDAYTAALYAQADAEQALEDSKKRAQAASELAGLGKAPEVMYGDGMPQQFDEAARMQERLNQMADFHARRIQLLIDAGHTEEEINAAKNEAQLAHDQQTAQMRLSVAQGAMGMMSNLMQNLFVATGSKNKAMFEAMKAFSIAETAIQTYRAAQGAYAALAPIPIIGPALATAAAAAAIVAGLARVRQIASMQPGGATGAISAGGQVAPSWSGGSFSAYPPVQPVEQKKEERPLAIQIHIYGNVVDHDQFARELIPAIQKQIGDNVH